MKNFIVALFASLILTSCVAYADPPLPPPNPSYGCFMVEDDYGEREVCNAYYYDSPYGSVYWDTYFGMWIGAGGYWSNGVWYHGYYPGYQARYGGFYHGHGYYHGYSHHWGGGHGGYGGYHGGGYHGGHGGGGHGGGGHGGHR